MYDIAERFGVEAKFATNVKATFADIRREDKGSIIGLSKVCERLYH